jgi:hypothetical protein
MSEDSARDAVTRAGPLGQLAGSTDATSLAPQLDQLRARTGAETPVTVGHFGANTPGDLAAYRELGVERVLFDFTCESEAESLRTLDDLADVVALAG